MTGWTQNLVLVTSESVCNFFIPTTTNDSNNSKNLLARGSILNFLNNFYKRLLFNTSHYSTDFPLDVKYFLLPTEFPHNITPYDMTKWKWVNFKVSTATSDVNVLKAKHAELVFCNFRWTNTMLGILVYLIACSRWAFLTSGFIFLLAMMSVREAPTIALWNFWVRRVRFFACSSSWPFLCLRLSQMVQISYNNVNDTFLKNITYIFYNFKMIISGLAYIASKGSLSHATCTVRYESDCTYKEQST